MDKSSLFSSLCLSKGETVCFSEIPVQMNPAQEVPLLQSQEPQNIEEKHFCSSGLRTSKCWSSLLTHCSTFRRQSLVLGRQSWKQMPKWVAPAYGFGGDVSGNRVLNYEKPEDIFQWHPRGNQLPSIFVSTQAAVSSLWSWAAGEAMIITYHSVTVAFWLY